MVERNFDIPFVADLALHEKQIQQNYRPIIGVHKWFARRPGTLFRSLLLAEFAQIPLRQAYYQSHQLKGIHVADPFMGGGTPILEANRLGCDVTGYDINPLAFWIVRQEIDHLDTSDYREAAGQLTLWLDARAGHYYKTRCLHCDSECAHVKYFLWVKILDCQSCGQSMDLFPGYLLAENQRHPRNVFVCAQCGELTETNDRKNPGRCNSCGSPIPTTGPARRNRCPCPRCGTVNTYPNPAAGPPAHRLFAIEYHCPECKPTHAGRFFKKPDADDLARYIAAEAAWSQEETEFAPDDEIPAGDETNRLHRWGYRHYREMFNARQLLGLELSARFISDWPDSPVRNALATNLSDLLRYQNMLCRYDTMALKSLDIFSVHGFPVGLVQCESNLLGIAGRHRGTNVGSGGWSNIVEKYAKAKDYCESPFEVVHRGSRKVQVPVPGEWIGDQRRNAGRTERRGVALHCQSAHDVDLPPASLDAVITDPPYLGNVQYAELMDFCYVWLRRLVGGTLEAFQPKSTRNLDELTANVTLDRGVEHFTEGLSAVFCRMAAALKPGSPLMFTYHHNRLEAYFPIAVGILDAGLTCSASVPCPAEMGASIHINGTGSSIVDSVFVCRSTGKVPRRWIAETVEEVAALVRDDIEQLAAGNLRPTRGDIRCIIFGHLIRLAVWDLRQSWNRDERAREKLAVIAKEVRRRGSVDVVEQHLGQAIAHAPLLQHWVAREDRMAYGADTDEVSF